MVLLALRQLHRQKPHQLVWLGRLSSYHVRDMLSFFGGEDQQRATHECTSPVMMPWCSETFFLAKRVGLLVPAVSQLAVIQTATCRSVDRHPSSVQPAEAGVVSEKCLCVFDIDRTLTSKQGMQDLLLTMSYHMSHDMVFLICR